MIKSTMEEKIWLIGLMTVLYFAFHLLKFVWKMTRCYLLPKFGFAKDLKTYGDWAVITGATDGIGLEYSKQLAEKGINVILISRTTSRLEKVAAEIEKKFKVKTKVIAFDFAKNSVSDYGIIAEGIKGLDIGILINNVGMSYGGLELFEGMKEGIIADILYCNIFSDVFLTKVVLKGMLARGHGLVVHISSGSMFVDAPGLNIYPATKIFMAKFTKALQMENVGSIDHQLIIPMYVATKMSKVSPRITIPTPEEYVRQALRSVGTEDCLTGYWSHEILGVVLRHIPKFIFVPIYGMIRKKRLSSK